MRIIKGMLGIIAVVLWCTDASAIKLQNGGSLCCFTNSDPTLFCENAAVQLKKDCDENAPAGTVCKAICELDDAFLQCGCQNKGGQGPFPLAGPHMRIGEAEVNLKDTPILGTGKEAFSIGVEIPQDVCTSLCAQNNSNWSGAVQFCSSADGNVAVAVISTVVMRLEAQVVAEDDETNVLSSAEQFYDCTNISGIGLLDNPLCEASYNNVDPEQIFFCELR